MIGVSHAQQVLLAALPRRRRGSWPNALALHYRTVAIAPIFDAFMDSLELTGLAEENLQARIRGVILMGISNQEGPLVLATGNKSELAVGYSTIYGDAVGGYAPIKDVPKTLVWQLCRWRNAVAVERGETPPIPENSISKPPSAELRPGQMDTDSLPDYALLDDILDDYVEADRSFAELIATGFDPGVVSSGAGPDRQGRVQAAPVPARDQDLGPRLRPRSPSADHQPLARAGLTGANRT